MGTRRTIPLQAGNGYRSNSPNWHKLLDRELSGGDGIIPTPGDIPDYDSSAGDGENGDGPFGPAADEIGSTGSPDVAEEPLKEIWPSPSAPLEVAQKIVNTLRGQRVHIIFWSDCWYMWDGTRYARFSNTALRSSLYDQFRYAVYKNAKVDKATGQEILVKWNPDKAKIDKVVDALKSCVFIRDNVQPGDWLGEQGPRIIPCRNGLLRVSDRVLMEHTPNYFNTFALPFDYDRYSDAPRWMDFLDEILPFDYDAQETLQEWCGYVLSGRNDLQKMLMLIGPTRSGKGTIDKVLAALVGADNRIGLAASDMRGDFGLQPLLGKTIAVFSDERVSIDGKRFVETLLRITGEDEVTVNRKNRESWIGQLGTRLMFMSNEPPMLPDASGAIVGRMVALHLPKSFLNKEDHGLIGKLYAELPGILNWSLDGLDRLTERGRFRQPESGENVIGLLHESASSVDQFVRDRCILGPDKHVRTAELYAHWKSWCSENGYDAGSTGTFGRKLFALGEGIENRKTGPKGQQKRHYFGIDFRWNVLVNMIREEEEEA